MPRTISTVAIYMIGLALQLQYSYAFVSVRNVQFLSHGKLNPAVLLHSRKIRSLIPYDSTRSRSSHSRQHILCNLPDPQQKHTIERFQSSNSAGSIDERRREFGIDIKAVALILLVAQNALQMLSMRYSRVLISSGQAVPYLSSTAVVMSEVLKVGVCLAILAWQHGKCLPSVLWNEIFVSWRETAKVAVPALVYMLQNNLLYIAASNLDAATCQITYQLKILTTAMFAVTMLGQSISKQKWAALAILVIGIVLVQLPQMTVSAATRAAAAAAGGSPAVGLTAVIAACFMSGFAGVWFEKILKTSKTSIWLRNVQLGFIGGVLGLAGALAKDGAAIHAGGGFLQGYTPLVWAVVAQVGLGGLLVAVVVKYADNVQKGFATSLSIVVSGLVSFFLIPSFAFRPTPPWLAGSALVLFATYLYSLPPRGSTAK